MAGKDDLRLLSAFVYSKAKTNGIDKGEIQAISASVMNRATELGSLQEAIQTMNPGPELMDIIQGNIKDNEKKDYRRVIQSASRLLKSPVDITGGAIEFLPKRTKLGKQSGLTKTHSTKNFNFYKAAPISGGMQGMPKATI